MIELNMLAGIDSIASIKAEVAGAREKVVREKGDQFVNIATTIITGIFTGIIIGTVSNIATTGVMKKLGVK